MPRLYIPGELAARAELRLPDAQGHHAVRVLRLAAGDVLTLFNGDGTDYDAVITAGDRQGVSVRITGRRAAGCEPRLELLLGQALSSGERMDYTVQKAVELGVAGIFPLAAARSVVRLDAARAQRRVAHWQAVAVAACEQCGRNRVPAVAAVATLDDWLSSAPARDAGALKLLLAPGAGARLRALPAPAGPVLLLAGPEGGFTAEEAGRAQAAGFAPVTLGPRVLRTETAAVAALAAMQALWGDF